jgi:hypothetical protein
MANPILFLSSWLMLCCHLTSLAVCARSLSYQPGLLLSYVLGPLTSLWNHGGHSRVAMWCDRVTMLLGFLYDLHLLHMRWPMCRLDQACRRQWTFAVTNLLWAVAFYIVQKQALIPKSLCHVAAHVCVCLAHHGILTLLFT